MSMSRQPVVSVDAMGGDDAPGAVVAGIELSLKEEKPFQVLLHGDEKRLVPYLESYPLAKAASIVRHCDVAVGMEESPSQALRRGRHVSSMWNAIASVREGEAHMAVSAGNTGALLAMSNLVLGTMPEIERPALAVLFPTIRNDAVFLDVGANLYPSGLQLAQFAVMGAAYARMILGVEKPLVGLLNVGIEDSKGTKDIRAAAEWLRAQGLREAHLPMEFHGFVEGNDLTGGVCDVIVTGGFTGNVALKTAEGAADFIAYLMRSIIKRSWLARFGYLFMRDAFEMLWSKMEPQEFNGGVMLGLNQLVVKSHGHATAGGFASALGVALEMSSLGLVEHVREDLRNVDFQTLEPQAGNRNGSGE